MVKKRVDDRVKRLRIESRKAFAERIRRHPPPSFAASGDRIVIMLSLAALGLLACLASASDPYQPYDDFHYPAEEKAERAAAVIPKVTAISGSSATVDGKQVRASRRLAIRRFRNNTTCFDTKGQRRECARRWLGRKGGAGG